MSPPTRRCSVFLTPSGDDYNYCSTMIRELGPKFGAHPFEPHLTLYSGSFTDPKPLCDAAASCFRGCAPMDLDIRGIGYTEEYFRTLFIEFEPKPLLLAMRNAIGTMIDDNGDTPFLPHLSLLYHEMPLEEKMALAAGIVLDRHTLRFDRVKIVTPGNSDAGWRDTLNWDTLASFGLDRADPV